MKARSLSLSLSKSVPSLYVMPVPRWDSTESSCQQQGSDEVTNYLVYSHQLQQQEMSKYRGNGELLFNGYMFPV